MFREKVITIIFILFIFLIPIVSFVNDLIPRQVEENEEQKAVLEANGTLANLEDTKEEEVTRKSKFDSIKWSEEKNWIKRLRENSARFCETFVTEPFFVNANSNITYELSNRKYVSSSEVIVGNEGYLFYKTKINCDPLSDYIGYKPFTDEELTAAVDNLVTLRDKLKNKGAQLYVLIVPNKEIIYERYMPTDIIRVNTFSRGEQLCQYVENNTDINILYPKDALIKESYENQMYYKTDTHCTQLGAYITFMEFYEMRYGEKYSLDDATFAIANENYAGDLATIVPLKNYEVRDTMWAFKGSKYDCMKDETILFVGDSMTGYQSIVASGYFKNVYRINTADLSMEVIDKYKPDVVIYESVERQCETFGW